MPRAMNPTRLLFAIVCIFGVLLVPVWAQSQAFSLPGSFNYALNSVNQVFDVDSTGTMGIALTSGSTPPLNPLLTTFNPASGQALDSKSFGFGALGVRFARIPEGLRAVVLTSQGGPRNIFLFDVSATGLITTITQTQLTPAINDGGSQLVVSPAAKAGFVLAYAPTGTGKDLVSFSLVNGSILARVHIEPVLGLQDVLGMVETADGRRLLTFFDQLASVAILDATNVAQPVLLGKVPLTSNPIRGLLPAGVAFSPDGRYLFASNGNADLSAIDVATRSVVGSIAGALRFGKLEASQGVSGTQLAGFGDSASFSGIVLVDAGDPAHLTIVRQHTLPGFSYKSGMKFSKNGRKLYVSTNTEIVGLDLPTLDESFLVPIAGSNQAQQIIAPPFCAPEKVVAAWAVGLSLESTFFVTSSIAPASGSGPRAARDSDGDGKSDILWRDTAGNISLWQMNGSAIAVNISMGAVWTGWTIVGSGDFNGNGKADILWRDIDGNVVIWLMDGAATCAFNAVGKMPLSTTLAGVADFNGDGKADILWRTSSGDVVMWQMNGVSITSSTVIANIWMGWTIAGSGDFNGDGKADILWRETSGDVAMWLMNGPTVSSYTSIANIWSGWGIAGIADFNADGKADILWRETSGDVAVWLMNGPVVSGSAGIANVWPDWVIAGARDFDGNGRADILWRDSSGNVAVWFMNGTSVSSYSGLGNVADRIAQ